MSGDAPGGSIDRRVAWAVALAATLTMTVSYIDRATLAVLAPSVTKALDIDETAYGWLSASFSIAYLVATPLSGWWIDRAGARRGLVYSVLLWSSFAALHALVPGFGMLLALRIALGIAEGPSFPGSAQTVQRILPAGERARGFGVLFTGSSIGAMLVPPLASWLYDVSGWRVAFLGTAAIGLLWIPLWMYATSRPGVRQRLDTPAETVANTTRPTMRQLVRDPMMIRALFGIFAAAGVLGFLQTWGAKYLVREFRVLQEDVGQYLWLPPLCLDAGAILFGDLASRQRRAAGAPPRLLHAIAAVMATALALIPLADSPWEAMAFGGIAYAGGGAMYTLVTADVLSRMPQGSVSTAAGILAGSQSLALIIMNPIIGRAVDYTGNYIGVTITLGLLVIPTALIWSMWPVRRSA
jgi:MFS transporter, ACS family, hexuronate transporter